MSQAPSSRRNYSGQEPGPHVREAADRDETTVGPSAWSLPTLAEILRLPELQRGHPTLEAAKSALDRPVRWVHVSELADIAHLLKGGELILSTGVALPSTADALSRYISDLAAAGVAGVVIELGRRFAALPSALVQSAEAHNLPLVALHSEVPFVAITEAIHSIIVNVQVKQLQRRDTIQQAFRTLAAEAASAQEIIDQMAELAQCPVVFESSARHVLLFAREGTPSTNLLEDWDVRSREASWAPQTGVTGTERWLTTPVSARGQVWGRLILLPQGHTTPDLMTILEQGATTLALHLLIERDERLLEHQTHRTLIADIINRRYASPEEIHARADALGSPTRRRTLVPMIVASAQDATLADIERQARAREEVTAISNALSDSSATGLVGLLEPYRIGVLLSATSPGTTRELVERVARAIHDRCKRLGTNLFVAIGVGSHAGLIDELRHSFAEANEAADVAWNLPADRAFATVADIHLEGLMHLLREDPRLQSYADREIGPIMAYDRQHHSELLKTLAAYLEAGGNKSAAATRAHITRATLYNHLSRIKRVLDCDLERPQVRYSLYVALVVQRAVG